MLSKLRKAGDEHLSYFKDKDEEKNCVLRSRGRDPGRRPIVVASRSP